MFYYAQIDTQNICTGTSSLADFVTQANMIAINEEQYQTNSVVTQQYNASTQTWTTVPPAPAPDTWIITRNAFQNRFPITANGVSTKYDLATLFLNDAGYAASLGVTGADLYSLRALIITGNNRLNVVSDVNLQDQAAIDYVNMMTNVAFPEVFRLTSAEANTILTTPAAPNEIP